MEIRDHRLMQARQIESPHYDERPSDLVDLLVIHCISLPAGHYGTPYVEALFCGRLDCAAHSDFHDLENLRVSSHLLIRRGGEIDQFVPFDKRAWHAGASTFCGRDQCNDFSIGIELEGTEHNRYRDAQYESLIAVCRALVDVYRIPPENIVGHSDIAPGRKTDPGPCFDWQKLQQVTGGPR